MTGIIKLTDRYTEAAIDDEIVVMRIDTGDFFALSGTGAVIWAMIDGQRDRMSIVAELIEQFDVSEREIQPQVGQFLHQLYQAGLIVQA
jgi:hypothetical protein